MAVNILPLAHQEQAPHNLRAPAALPHAEDLGSLSDAETVGAGVQHAPAARTACARGRSARGQSRARREALVGEGTLRAVMQ